MLHQSIFPAGSVGEQYISTSMGAWQTELLSLRSIVGNRFFWMGAVALGIAQGRRPKLVCTKAGHHEAYEVESEI